MSKKQSTVRCDSSFEFTAAMDAAMDSSANNEDDLQEYILSIISNGSDPNNTNDSSHNNKREDNETSAGGETQSHDLGNDEESFQSIEGSSVTVGSTTQTNHNSRSSMMTMNKGTAPDADAACEPPKMANDSPPHPPPSRSSSLPTTTSNINNTTNTTSGNNDEDEGMNDVDFGDIGEESHANSSVVTTGEGERKLRSTVTSTTISTAVTYEDGNSDQQQQHQHNIEDTTADDSDKMKAFDTVYTTFSDPLGIDNPSPRQTLDREILFDDSINYPPPLDNGSDECRKRVQGYTNKLWNMQTNRVLTFTGPVARVLQSQGLRYFFAQDQYVPRILAIYKDPNLIMILRLPYDVDEIRKLLPIQSSGHDDNACQEEMSSLMSSFLVAESVIDTQACKLRLSQLTNSTSVPTKILLSDKHGGRRTMLTSKIVDPRSRSCIEILTPSEVVVLSAVVDSKELPDTAYETAEAVHETRRIEYAITEALFNAYSGKYDHSDSWKHQVILGTLHSYVISGNNHALKEALVNALDHQHANKREGQDIHESKYVGSSIIDAKDDDGNTALHLACMRRSNIAVTLLVDAGANCWIPTLAESKTACHLSAERLDVKSLSIVLSQTYPARPDPNALDFLGRTPCYLATLGTGITGQSDSVAMGLCLSALEAWGGQLMITGFPDSNKLLHPIHLVATQWKHAELLEILSHCHYYYPLTNADGSDSGGISLGALYHYPLHAALISLRKHIFNVFGGGGGSVFGGDSIPADLPQVQTLQVLLEHGFEPNERFEGVVGRGSEIKSLSEYFGLTPLQILVVAAKELRAFDKQRQEGGSDCFHTMHTARNIMDVIQSCAALLLKNGARTNLPPPTPTRLDRETPPVCYSLNDAMDGRASSSSLLCIDRDELNFDDSVMDLLGGVDRVSSLQRSFGTMTKTVTSTGTLKIQKGLSSAIDCDAPGGSDSCSCAICWSEFGMISNRKQFCQVSCRYVCNDCSMKRLKDNGSEYRISDGQYNIARALAAKESTNSRAKQEEASRNRRFREAQARTSLFKAKNSGSRSLMESEKQSSSVAGLASSMISSISQTKDAVLKRGDKLNSLADKSEALNKASMDFAAMAKELNRQQNSFFGF